MQFRRPLALLFTILSLHLFSLPVMAEVKEATTTQATGVAATAELPAAAKSDIPVHFKSGVKYDPTTHGWRDTNTNQKVDLGLAGLNGKYGSQQLLADASTSATAKVATGFPWKKVIFITIMVAGIATAIAVPIAVAHHNNHHGNNNAMNNQAAAYYYLHNQTLPVPVIQQPPPYIPPRSGPPPPPPKMP